MLRLAFDIGGTFTDFVLHDGDAGRVHSLKIPSTPSAPQDAVLDGTRQLLAQAGVQAGSVEGVLHATTVATNAVLERKGAPTGLITTRGFRDVLIIGRQKRYEIYDLYLHKPAPLVRRRHIVEVGERTDFEGNVVDELDEESVERAIAQLLSSGRKAVAICLLHAYANGAHEERIAARLAELAPDISVSMSSEVSAKFREYERTSTTVANAYVQPIVSAYMNGLQQALQAMGFANDLFVMQSSGGLVSPEAASRFPIRIIESGPAAGVLMGQVVGKAVGEAQLITFDMGGTTAKLGAIDDGQPAIMPTFEIDHRNYKKGSGLPINVPAVELLEIGAGGGSIAQASMGMIAVGPESAGADPGPICYGKGGTRPTITDANLVLGYLSPAGFNDGRMRLDVEAAAEGIQESVAQPLGLNLAEAAWGIHLVATGNMENAMRIVSVERGRDPRRYAMVAFGGAGPLHASRLARAVGIPKIIVPLGAGVGSAIGLLAARSRIDVSMTRVLALSEDNADEIAGLFAQLQSRVRADLAQMGASQEPVWTRYAQMRYAGQGFELHVDLPAGSVNAAYITAAREAFDRTYLRKHRFLDDQGAVEVVDWTVVATLPDQAQTDDFSQLETLTSTAASAEPVWRDAYFPEAGGYVSTPVLTRAALQPGVSIDGPVIIEDPDATVLVLPGDQVELTAAGHLVILTPGSSS